MIRSQFTFCITVFFTLLSFSLSAQVNSEDPFFNNYKLNPNGEFITLDGSDTTAIIRVFDASGDISTDSLIERYTHPVPAPWGMVIDRDDAVADMVSGDFDGDGSDEIMAVWAGVDSSVVLFITDVDTTSFAFVNENISYVQDDGYPNLYVITDEFDTQSIVRLELAQFDRDPEPEVVLSYLADDGSADGTPIQIIAYDFNGGTSPSIIGNIADVVTSPKIADSGDILRRSAKYELQAGDFDGDGTDELALLYTVPDLNASFSKPGWSLVGAVYDVTMNEISRTGSSPQPYYTYTGNRNDYLQRIAADAGDYNGDGFDELVLSEGIGYTNRSEMDYTLYAFTVPLSLDSLNLASENNTRSSNGSAGFPMSMTTYDINLDGSEEFVYQFREQLEVGGLVDGFRFTTFSTSTFLDVEQNDIYHRTVAVTDVDILENDSLRIEAANIDRSGLRVWQNRPDLALGDSGIRLRDEDGDPVTLKETSAIVLATGDLDGDAVRFGPPIRQRVTDLIQPLVVLNAPPIHFDVFDGQNFDINKCFVDDPQISCEHKAIYQTANSQEFEVSSTVSADWGVSTSLEGEVSGRKGIVSGSVTARLDASYGEGFSRTNGASRTVTVTLTSEAIDDDRIYSTIADYDILEYPVYAGGILEGYVGVVVPDTEGLETLQNTWLGSKSGLASDYLNQHEVGNILSYPSTAQLPDGATIFGDGGFEGGGGDTWEMSGSSSQSWELQFSSESISQRTRSTALSLGASVSAEGKVDFGLVAARAKATVSGEFNLGTLSTHTTTVRTESALRTEFGTIDGSILGTKTYTVSPFVYWGNGGALTLDYAVQPDVSAGVASWWESRYGSQPDLTMILPWKYDQQKGLGSTNPELQRKQTRDILFVPERPQRGDLVSIQARIQNYSLSDQLTPFTVEFYIGDPDNGGTLIVNESGMSSVTLPALLSRESAVASLADWRVPQNVNSNTFIYAVIDREESVTEVHEDNNVGWVLLNELLPSGLSNEEGSSQPDRVQLSQNYPNPFNPVTNIRFELPAAGQITLKVFNALGQEVLTLADGIRSAGTHMVRFNAAALPSGMYMYQLRTPQATITRKMMLIK